MDKCAIDFFTTKKKKTKTVTALPEFKQNPCEQFLLSLVPQMESMSSRQQLSFQKDILQLIEKIEYPVQSNSEQQDIATSTAVSYCNSFGVGSKKQETTLLQNFTPAQQSYSHTHLQQTAHLHMQSSYSHTNSQC